MLWIIVLLDVQSIVLFSKSKLKKKKKIYVKFDHCTFVVINVTIVGSGKNRDDHWEVAWSIPFMHLVAFHLSFMGSDHREQVVSLKEFINRCEALFVREFILKVIVNLKGKFKRFRLNSLPEKVWTTPHFVAFVNVVAHSFIIVYWISPKQITEIFKSSIFCFLKKKNLQKNSKTFLKKLPKKKKYNLKFLKLPKYALSWRLFKSIDFPYVFKLESYIQC